MNNNGVTTNNTNAAENPVLKPMAGVTIAPASDGPVNASAAGNTTQQPAPATGTTPQQQPTQPAPAAPTPVSSPQPSAQPAEPILTPIPNEPTANTTQPPQPKKKGLSLTPILLLIIFGLGFYLYYSTAAYNNKINQLNYNCTPITSSKEEKKLDINSTLVQGLYHKVATNIKEDLAQPEFNDQMRLYLAYRQILETDKYDSNCNEFSSTAMEPYLCEVSTNFVPKAFKTETLTQEIKKLYGEQTQIPITNIQLGSSCIVGYQYIQSRDEFVQGYCKTKTTTSYKVTKTLKDAISTQNTIVLTEEVKYHENEKLPLPESLKNGIYYYTFRLDMNYNYVLVSKTYESKYE